MDGNGEKPTGNKAGWRLRGSVTRFENEICKLREDEVELEGGKRTQYAYLERDEAVIIVPVTRDGEIVMLQQYRYPVDEWCLEVPAGGTHDTENASLEQVARKELREEIGGTAEKLTYVTFFYSANAFSNEKCHVFLAEGVTLSKQPDREESEAIGTQLTPVGDALALARRGEMKTAPCALALLLCKPLLRERKIIV